MNREIKFRAWLPNHKKMTYAHEIDELIGWDIKGDHKGTAIWLQYTGLKDKNGNEIFEGDVVAVNGDKPMVVGWSKRFASFVLNREGWAYAHWFGESCDPESCEVIGSIFTHPELVQTIK